MSNTNFKIKWPLIGNSQITEYLEKCLDKKSISGSFIFNGPDNLGKTTVANFFARSVLCFKYNEGRGEVPCDDCPSCKSLLPKQHKNTISEESPETMVAHGDFYLVRKDKDKKNITVEQVRDLIKRLEMSSFLNSYKIGIVKHADFLGREAANALLKTLEEPRDKVVIILVTHDMDRLPATIRSRTQILNFRPVNSDVIYDYLIEEHQARRSEAKKFSRLALGRPALAVKFYQDQEFYLGYMEKVNTFLDFPTQTVYERFAAIAKLVSGKAAGQEAVIQAQRTLEVWLGLVRDAILTHLNYSNLVQHEEQEIELMKLTRSFNIDRLLNLYKEIRTAELNLFANVQPRLALENIAISF